MGYTFNHWLNHPLGEKVSEDISFNFKIVIMIFLIGLILPGFCKEKFPEVGNHMPTVKSFRKSQILGIKLSLSMFILFCIFKSYHQNQFTINYNIIMRNPNTQTSKKDPSHLNH